MDKNLVYFVSDVHLGLTVGSSSDRERRFADFLKSLPLQTKAVYLLGDIFDFWFEYRFVVPKGFVRTLGALADLADRGVEVYFFKGNHDMWTFGYLEQEIGLKLLHQPHLIEIGGKRFCIGHGDGFDKTDKGYQFLKAIFSCRILQRLLSFVHPGATFSVAHRWSKHNRLTKGTTYKFKGAEEPLYRYAEDFEKQNKVDYFVFGHLHTPGNIKTSGGAEFYILGEWIHGCEYLVFDTQSGFMSWQSST